MNGVEHTPYLHSLAVFLLCHCGRPGKCRGYAYNVYDS
nr:MAG TPA: hypothetical protein [Caudoviricetes sp.]